MNFILLVLFIFIMFYFVYTENFSDSITDNLILTTVNYSCPCNSTNSCDFILNYDNSLYYYFTYD